MGGVFIQGGGEEVQQAPVIGRLAQVRVGEAAIHREQASGGKLGEIGHPHAVARPLAPLARVTAFWLQVERLPGSSAVDPARPARIREFVGREIPVVRTPLRPPQGGNGVLELNLIAAADGTGGTAARPAPWLIALIDPAQIHGGLAAAELVEHQIGLHQINQVAGGVMHQRIIGLPGGNQVNVPERLERGMEGVGRLLVAGDELALEELDGHLPGHARRKFRGGGVPVRRDVSQAGLNLVLDAKGGGGHVIRRSAIHAVGAPHAAILPVLGVGHTAVAAPGESLGQVLEVFIAQVHIVNDPLCALIHQRKSNPGL